MCQKRRKEEIYLCILLLATLNKLSLPSESSRWHVQGQEGGERKREKERKRERERERERELYIRADSPPLISA